MPGMFMRAIAITLPGMFLSQPPMQTTPSMSWPLTAVSIESAITSRDTSEYFIPSVPMPMPSVTVGKPKVCGFAPACSSAATARSTSGWMPALQGFMVECPFATPVSRIQFDDLLFLAVLGVILGGRLGYVLFYKPGYYASHPLEIFALWQGGMSFHGGLLGVMLAMTFAARRHRVDWLQLMDF